MKQAEQSVQIMGKSISMQTLKCNANIYEWIAALQNWCNIDFSSGILVSTETV